MSDTPNTVKVRLLTETHEHENKKVPKGTVLEMHPATATHLIELKAVELVSGGASMMSTGTATAARAAGGE